MKNTLLPFILHSQAIAFRRRSVGDVVCSILSLPSKVDQHQVKAERDREREDRESHNSNLRGSTR